MKFYVGWSHSDAMYSDIFEGCPMLISAVPENNRPLRRFRVQPRSLIVDSGALYYNAPGKAQKLRDIFNRQLEVIQDASPETDISLVHVDKPMLNQNSLSARYAAMEKTLYNAYEYLGLFRKSSLSNRVKALGVVQGFDRASLRFAALELLKMGYENFGVGSLIGRNVEEQMDFVEQVAEIVGADRLHVFGVTGIPQIRRMAELRVASFDSTRPTMVAAYYQVFYSNPFRTYVLSASKVANRNRTISEPLPCECPVCEKNSDGLLIPSPRVYMKMRSIHNYYHFVKTIEEILAERGERFAVPNVLRTGD